MNEFKLGDHVRVTGGDDRGAQGVVFANGLGGLWRVKLHAGEFAWYASHDLELAPAPDQAEDVVSHPNHYTAGVPEGIEAIDIIRAHMAAGGTWETANALKYILRHTLKGNPAQDIAKAAQYLTMWTQQQQETA